MVTGTLVNRRRLTARSVALVIVTAIALGVAALPASSVTPRAEAAKATEIGVTPTTIRVAVVADVDNTIVPGVLQGIVDGVQGWGKYVDANGGIAGRKVQVDFIDSHLNPNDARNAIIKACTQDFTLVGTSGLLLTNADDENGCVDQAGAATGLPDMGAIVTATSQACSPVSFPILSPTAECSTLSAHPQTFRYNVGDAKYHIKAAGKLHGSYSVAVDSPSVKIGSFGIAEAYQKAGIKADHEPWQVTGTRLAEHVHADHPGHEEQPVELRLDAASGQRGGRGAPRGDAPRPHRPENHLGLHARLLFRRCSPARGKRSTASTCRSRFCRSTRPPRTR